MKCSIKTILMAVMCLISQWNYAQYSFVKQWDYRFGGTLNDGVSSFNQTKDGGFILAGSSYSGVSGDKTQLNWDTTLVRDDFWLVKLDSTGQKQWDKRFGGVRNDRCNLVRLTKDGGFILGGSSTSPISGDKTENIWDTAFFSPDFWIIKTDALGNKQWDRRFGGSRTELFSSIEITADGGYIMGGLSRSGISGDKTEGNWDVTLTRDDYWVVKIDSLGNKQWDRRFGGTGQDGLEDIKASDDGGYLLGGYSNSGITGNKTEALYGFGDYWVVKIDSLGNYEWDRDYGATSDDNFAAMVKTNDDCYLIGGIARGGTGSLQDVGCGYDYHIIKIDSIGNQLWDKAYGGGPGSMGNGGEDYLESIYVTTDGGYLLGGQSTAPASCNKSEFNLGDLQPWIVKIDSIGNKQWDKTIFLTKNGWVANAIETVDGCYTVAISTTTGIGGYKTQTNWDASDSTSDYWIMKFCMDTVTGVGELTGKVQITVYPNPFATDVAISVQKENLREATFTINNSLGQIIYQREENNLSQGYTKMLDLRYLPNGLYFITVEADGERVVRRVVKE